MIKSISKNPKRGDVYECIFGNYLLLNMNHQYGPYCIKSYDYRIPNEIRKRRPVVILGERKKQLLVVPISSTLDRPDKPLKGGESAGLHIKLNGDEVPLNKQYQKDMVRWAKVDLMQSVDIKRLREFRLLNGSHAIGKVSNQTLGEIQLAVLRMLGLSKKIEEFKRVLQGICQ